jgi:hypothetical protein
MTEDEAHLTVTEYDGHRLHWWCSCGYDTDSLQTIKQHLERKDYDDRAMRER